MNMGRFLAIVLVLSGLIAGVSMYYLQVYAYYEDVPEDQFDVQLVNLATGKSESIAFDNFKAIDASSSPIRYRACFTTDMSQPLLTETYQMYDDAEPRIAPGWFDCFDAKTISQELEAGTALAFMGTKNVHYGVDRIVAITEDGHGYVWHEPNNCGDLAYDGSPDSEACPAHPETQGNN